MKKRIIEATPGCMHNSPVGCLLGVEKCSPECSRSSSNGVFQLMSKDVAPLRNKILELQGGKCKICGIDLTGDSAACLDHHHQKKIKGSGLVRGVLCRACNTYAAKCENNATRCGIQQDDLPITLIKISNYLVAQQYPYLHPTEKPKVKKIKKTSYNLLIKAMKAGREKKLPTFPEKGGLKLTKPLEALFNKYKIVPEYYK